MNALRTGNDLIWLLQYDGSSDRCALARCLHPMELCALQGFQPEQLVALSMSGILRATGIAMSTAAVAAASKRCVEVLACRLGTHVPRGIQKREEERERRRTAIKLLRECIAQLEAQEAVLRRMRASGALVRESRLVAST